MAALRRRAGGRPSGLPHEAPSRGSLTRQPPPPRRLTRRWGSQRLPAVGGRLGVGFLFIWFSFFFFWTWSLGWGRLGWMLGGVGARRVRCGGERCCEDRRAGGRGT